MSGGKFLMEPRKSNYRNFRVVDMYSCSLLDSSSAARLVGVLCVQVT